MDITSKRVAYVLVGLLFTGILFLAFVGLFSLSMVVLNIGISELTNEYANQFYIAANIIAYVTLVGSFGYFFSLLIFMEKPYPSEQNVKSLNRIFYALIVSVISTLMWTSVVRNPILVILFFLKLIAVILLHFLRRNWVEKYELAELIDLLNRIEKSNIQAY